MEEGLRYRINLLIQDSCKSERAYADAINVVQVTLNRQLSGKRSVSLDTIDAVLRYHTDLSAEWLLRGEGDMYKKTTELPPVDVSSEDRINESVELGKITRKYNEAAEMIEQLKKKVALLEKTLEEERKDKERAIAQLDLASSLLRERLMMAESAQKVG